ncbi:hypothetical protein EFR84_33330 [Rhizobium chutanense]|uniref:Uncharacterized protein n=1 Tax=Rhizobium chutanense TaxID=2035448 RepID=A0A432N8Q9_9HYPH|nr:hypothetical protein EFR84_33330 [Rhizobium chutanense]
MDRPDDRAIIGVDPDHRMQIKTTTATGADHRRILDGQNMSIRATAGSAQGRLLDHLLRIDGIIAQKPGQTDLSGPMPSKLAHPHALTGRLNQTRQQERPPFSRRRSPNRPRLKSSIAQFSCLQQENQNCVP